MVKRSTTRVVITSAIVGLFASACGSGASTEATGGGGPTVTFSGLQDPAPLPALVMREEGIDEKYGFKAEFLQVDPEASTSTFLVGESDIAVDQNAVSAAIARNEGHDVVSFYPALNNTAGIVVPKDSSYQTPRALVGKKVGHFGVNSGTTQSVALTLREFYNVNPLQQYQLVKAGPPALPQLLAGGEVEAIVDFEPFPLRAVQITPGRYLMRVTDVWQREWNWSPPIAMLTAKTSWLRDNPELARKVVKAWKEATQTIVDSKYKIFRKDPYRSFLNLKNEKELEALINYCGELPCYPQKWNESTLQKQLRYLRLMAEHKSILQQMPDKPSVVLLDKFLGNQSG